MQFTVEFKKLKTILNAKLQRLKNCYQLLNEMPLRTKNILYNFKITLC